MKVGHDLNSCTTELHPVVITYPQPGGQRLVMVDTPGFDDTYMPDSEILRRIALWLATAWVFLVECEDGNAFTTMTATIVT